MDREVKNLLSRMGDFEWVTLPSYIPINQPKMNVIYYRKLVFSKPYFKTLLDVLKIGRRKF